MIKNFTYKANDARIIFGSGNVHKISDEIEALGCKRTLVLSTPFQSELAENIANTIGDLKVSIFSKAAMHTPVEVTEQAVELYKSVDADCVLSIGGGSTVGLGKAISYRTSASQIVVATTYAGSEVTPILGETENGLKTTIREKALLPEVVIYDPDLTLGLPVEMSVTSGLNSIAHAVEALYAKDKNPISSMMASEGIKALSKALPTIVKTPRDKRARAQALYGAWLCGTVLGNVGMALHHKICHTLGGTFNTPHAETHAIMLPHTTAYNAAVVSDLLEPIADLFNSTPGAGLYDFAASIGAPQALKDLGLTEKDLDSVADIATQNPYWNPRDVERSSIRELLQNAWLGNRPGN